MAAQLVFDNPYNRRLLDKYYHYESSNPEWEPLGHMKYAGKSKRGRGIDTVNIDGIEYYKNTSYGNPPYLHTNEHKRPFKIAGGKKNPRVSSFLDSAIPIATKYATAAAALGLPIAAGNPELVPASLLVQSDIHPILAKKLRKYVKEKTGYGVHQGRYMRAGVIDEDEDEVKLGDLPKPELKQIIKEAPKKTLEKVVVKLHKSSGIPKPVLEKAVNKAIRKSKAPKEYKVKSGKVKVKVAKVKGTKVKVPKKVITAKMYNKKRINNLIMAEEGQLHKYILPAGKLTKAKKAQLTKNRKLLLKYDDLALKKLRAENPRKAVAKKPATKKPAVKKPAAKKGGAMPQNPWLIEVRSYQHAHPHLSWKEAMQALSAKRKGY